MISVLGGLFLLSCGLFAQDLVDSVIKDDFLINDDTIGGCDQGNSGVGMDSTGNFVVVWEDSRGGHHDIYAHRFLENGQMQGENFKVNADTGIAEQRNPSIGMDRNGNFVIVWEDERHGHCDIYAQMFDLGGESIGNNFRINNDAGPFDHKNPKIAMNGMGDFTVVWEDSGGGLWDIYAQRFDKNGLTLGTNFKVNEDLDTGGCFSPSVAMNDSGAFVVAWHDSCDITNDVYAQRYNTHGLPVGSNFKVNDDCGNQPQGFSSVAISKSGEFVIAWQDMRDGQYDIYMQIYDQDGSPQGGNCKINDDIPTGVKESQHSSVTTNASSSHRYPRISIDESGTFIVTWEDYRNSNGDIYAQGYTLSGQPIGSNFQINSDSGINLQERPSIVVNGAGHFVIAWKDFRNGHGDIYIQRYRAGGVLNGDNLKVNDDERSSVQRYSDIAMNESGYLIVVWEDNRSGYVDIYGQLYDSMGNILGQNFKVNSNTGPRHQRSPRVAMNSQGSFVVVWRYDYPDLTLDILAQRYDPEGKPVGDNFIVNDCIGTVSQNYPSVGMDDYGNFVIVWRDKRGESFDIYLQYYDSTGQPLGNNMIVNGNFEFNDLRYPDVAVDSQGSFVVVWEDKRNGHFDIYGQRFDSGGQAVGNNFKISDDTEAFYQGFPRIAMDGTRNCIVTWRDNRNGNRDIYAQRYDSEGIPVGQNFRVNDDFGTAVHYTPIVAADDSGNFVIVWKNYQNGLNTPQIMVQRYYATGEPWGTNQLMVRNDLGCNQDYPAVAANGHQIAVLWQDNRRHKSWDIYGKLVAWDWDGETGIGQESDPLPSSFLLNQNFPNPFNSETIITYQLPLINSLIYVSLRIYNVSGQEIRTLVDDFQSHGEYRVKWNGKDNFARNVASGIYVYKLVTKDFSRAKRIVFLR